MALSALTEQRSDQLKQSLSTNRLFDEIGALGQVPRCGSHASGCDHDTDIVSILPYSAGQLEAIDAPAWHFHVRDNHLDVGSGRENMERLVRMSRLHDLETSMSASIMRTRASS